MYKIRNINAALKNGFAFIRKLYKRFLNRRTNLGKIKIILKNIEFYGEHLS